MRNVPQSPLRSPPHGQVNEHLYASQTLSEVSWRFVHNDTLECNEICLPHPCVPPGPPPVVLSKSYSG